MPPARRLPPRTLSSHREIAQRECYCERAGCVAARPPPEPLGAAERQTFRTSGYTEGTYTFPVHQHHGSTRRADSSTPGARAAQRHVDPTATHPLPSSGSPALPEDSLCASGGARTLWTETPSVRPHTPGTWTPAARTRQGPDTPRRPTCGSGQSPDAASALSRLSPQREKREALSCNSEYEKPAATPITRDGRKNGSERMTLHPPPSPSPHERRASHAKLSLHRRNNTGSKVHRRNNTGSKVPINPSRTISHDHHATAPPVHSTHTPDTPPDKYRTMGHVPSGTPLIYPTPRSRSCQQTAPRRPEHPCPASSRPTPPRGAAHSPSAPRQK